MGEEHDFRKQNMINMKLKRITDSQSRHHSVRRPEQVVRDVRGLKLRQRVSLVLGDELLRKELEDIVESTQTNGPNLKNGVRTYQDFLIPNLYPYSNAGSGQAGVNGAVTPISDIRGTDTLSMSKVERVQRSKLAAVYRLVDLFGWSQNIFNHITLRISEEKNNYLINPFGLLYNEITASSFMTIDLEGNVVDQGSTNFGCPKAGFVLHSAIHEARKDAKCIIHVHQKDVEAVSAMKCGLLRISQEAAIVGNVSYHNFCGILFDTAERESIANDLGPTNKVMILRNHGVVCIGETVEEAFSHLYHVIKACEVQVRAITVGLDNLHIFDEDIVDKVQKDINDGANLMDKRIKWKRGEMEFEALMRLLDSQGYKTGYQYRCPDVFAPVKKEKAPSSQVAPNVPSFNTKKTPYNYYYETDSSPFKASQSVGKGSMYRNRIKWLNSPVLGTQYKKEAQEKTDVNKNQLQKVVENRQEIIRTGSENNIDTTQTEVTETTETFAENGSTVTTVKRKVVTVTQGHEEVVEDSQMILEGDEIALKSVVDGGFVIVEKEEHRNGEESETAKENGTENVAEATPVKTEHSEGLLSPGSPVSYHSSNRSDDEYAGEHGDDDHDDKKKVKKQKSFKKAFMKKFQAKK